jgi:hypothetical protein
MTYRGSVKEHLENFKEARLRIGGPVWPQFWHACAAMHACAAIIRATGEKAFWFKLIQAGFHNVP